MTGSLPDLSEREEYEALLRGQMSSREWAERLKARCQRTHAADLRYMREAEAERDRLRAELEALRERIAVAAGNPCAGCRAQNQRLRDAVSFTLAALSTDTTHRGLGESCGRDACFLCAAEEKLRAASDENGASDD